MAAIQLQGGRWLKVFPSDNCIIPYPGVQSAGSSTATVSGKLVDSSASFQEEGILVGMIVYNTTDSTAATITGIENGTTLELNANIMASGKSYKIYAEPSDKGAKLYVSPTGDVNLSSVNGDTEVFPDLIGFVPLQCNKVWETGTDTGLTIIAIW